jgi:hypothetical protein
MILQSNSGSSNANISYLDRKGPSLMVSCILLTQMISTLCLCLVIVWWTETKNGQLTLPIVKTFQSEESWLWWTLLILVLVFWFGMHICLKLSEKYETKIANICLNISFIGFSFSVAFLFGFLSAISVCDPLIRMVIVSSTSKIAGNNNDAILWPFSEAEEMENDGWVRETKPTAFGYCVANTAYAMVGQRSITISASVGVISFIIAIFVAYVKPSSRVAEAVILCCGISVSILGGGTLIVVNEDIWDWRAINSLLLAFGVSSYLASCVVALDDPDSKNTFIQRIAWIYIQFAIVCEEAALRLTKNRIDL